ncbi:MAG: cation:proton antiporter [Gammaproteobacteria bacterium]|nr:cation:proton antiporter [Gammaproteobacteria bacterium]
MYFLPNFPQKLTDFAIFGLILLTGLLAGELAKRSRLLPAVSGYILIGLAIGPSGLNLLTAPLLDDARLFIDIALGLILFDLGRHLDIPWLRNDRGLLLMALGENLLSFALVFAALLVVDLEPLSAALIATIAMTTSPAVVMLVASDLRAEGPVTRRTLTLVAVSNILALVIFTALIPWTQRQDVGIALASWHSLYRLGGSLLIGYLAFLLSLLAARLLGKRESSQFLLFVSMVIIAISAARAFNLSVMLSLMSFGVCARNLDRQRRLMTIEFGYVARLFWILLFVMTGAYFRLDGFTSGAAAIFVVLLVIAVRQLGKTAGVLLWRKPGQLTARQAGLIALAITPIGGVALGMSRTITDFNAGLGGQLSLVAMAVLTVLDLLGPIATHHALRLSGETLSEEAQAGSNHHG